MLGTVPGEKFISKGEGHAVGWLVVWNGLIFWDLKYLCHDLIPFSILGNVQLNVPEIMT